jgi:CubicO group peptidase (beta-lactamase class C family)
MTQKLDVTRRRLGGLFLGGVAIAQTSSLAMAASNPLAGDGLLRRQPEAVGVSAESLLDFFAELDASKVELHSFMLWRKGAVIAEGWWWPYRPELIHMMHSATKSFTVCAVGMALAEGKFHLKDRVVSFFPEHLPPVVSANLAAMTVEDLLSMRTGHDVETSGSLWRPLKTSWIAEFYKIPVVHVPGTHYQYTSAATYMLSAIISKTTGQNTYAYLKPRLFEPLGITNEVWPAGPENITPGANGLSIRTDELLKLGILHAQDGVWNGKRILPKGWVQSVQQIATPAKGPDADFQGYGWQWWLDADGAYSARGLFGQKVTVMPRHDAVLAYTSASMFDTQGIERLVNKYTPIWFGSQKPLAAAPALDRALKHKTENLRLLPALRKDKHDAALGAKVSGKTYMVEKNEDGVTSISFDFQPDKVVFHIADDRGPQIVNVGLSDWIEGQTNVSGAKLHHEYELDSMRVVAGGLWLDENTFKMTWQFNESAFCDTVICRFDGDKLKLDRSVNVNSSDRERPTLYGKHA